MHKYHYDKLKEVAVHGGICSLLDAVAHIYENNKIHWLPDAHKPAIIAELNKCSEIIRNISR